MATIALVRAALSSSVSGPVRLRLYSSSSWRARWASVIVSIYRGEGEEERVERQAKGEGREEGEEGRGEEGKGVILETVSYLIASFYVITKHSYLYVHVYKRHVALHPPVPSQHTRGQRFINGRSNCLNDCQ